MAYCWKCGAQLYENSFFCHSCGASAKPYPTSALGAQTGFERLKDDKAFQDQWVKRIVAYVIDLAIVSVVAYFLLLVVAFPVVPAIFFGQTFPFAWFWGFWLGGIASLIVLAYFALAEAAFERTLGKELLGLRVTRLDGKHIDLWSSFVRNISKISFVLLVIDLAAGLGTHGMAGKNTATATLEPLSKPRTRVESSPTGYRSDQTLSRPGDQSCRSEMSLLSSETSAGRRGFWFGVEAG